MQSKNLKIIFGSVILAIIVSVICYFKPQVLNSPHPDGSIGKNTFFSSFTEQPKTLDPARSYSSNEAVFTAQIYEPPLQYHYLKRPYELVPLTATTVPVARYLDKNNQLLPANASDEAIAYTEYDIDVQRGIFYQPHPAFAKDKQGHYLYLGTKNLEKKEIKSLTDFEKCNTDKCDTRELTAADYVYQIKRLANPLVESPIYGLMSHYIVDLKNLRDALQRDIRLQKQNGGGEGFLDLRKYPLAGAVELSRYRYRIKLQGKYPQFLFWLAMPFFAPIPWEADYFYSQSYLRKRNIGLNWYPVGTGAYLLSKNDPNSEMVLERNPNFRGEAYPIMGSGDDVAQGLLKSAGQRMPFVDRYDFSLEKESIPTWTKFLQGYYDISGISSDNFDQTIAMASTGSAELSPAMKQKGIRLQTSVASSVFYMGFNMLDDVVGGDSDRARKLRQALSIAVNYEDFIAIFLNGRAIVAEGPLPPDIFGYIPGEKGINPFVFQWQHDQAERLPIERAKALMAEAGYPNGRDAKTGKPLLLHLDVPAAGSADFSAQLDWYSKQFAKLGIQLDIRATQYNRFQEKMRSGNTQLYVFGWEADYPDPENFLFLLYGPNGKVKFGGENTSNYVNPTFDQLFEKMKGMDNGPERQAIISQMLDIVYRDAPWIWGFYPKEFVLYQQWVGASKQSSIINNTLKYRKLDPVLRQKQIDAWNKPVIWPLAVLFLVLLLVILPAAISFYYKEYRPRNKLKLNNN